MTPMKSNFDVIIVGTGLAGLSAALRLADHRRILLVDKQALGAGASDWAQGGIAAVVDPHDSVEAHVQDTLVAGAGLCDEQATRFIISHGAEAVQWLIDEGVAFTPDSSSGVGFHLTREGGHGTRRIFHAADSTGHEIQQTLRQKVRTHRNITLLEQHMAVDLIIQGGRCVGIYLQSVQNGPVTAVAARQVVLATGGAGKVYLYTTNPDMRHRRRHRDGLARRLPRSRTWSSSSSIRPASTTRTPSPS